MPTEREESGLEHMVSPSVDFVKQDEFLELSPGSPTVHSSEMITERNM